MGTHSDHQKIQERWGKALDAGFVVVPVQLLRQQSQLGLDGTELVVLLNLFAFWHETNSPVWKAPGTIAKQMGVSVRTIQRAISSLESKGLIAQETGLDGKVIHLTGIRHVLADGKIKQPSSMDERVQESAADALRPE